MYREARHIRGITQIRDRIDIVKRRVSQSRVSRVNIMDHHGYGGKEHTRYRRRGKRVETTIGGNKIREHTGD